MSGRKNTRKIARTNKHTSDITFAGENEKEKKWQLLKPKALLHIVEHQRMQHN
jgi:hypothetical protein